MKDRAGTHFALVWFFHLQRRVYLGETRQKAMTKLTKPINFEHTISNRANCENFRALPKIRKEFP
jgi:hypothetical protein